MPRVTRFASCLVLAAAAARGQTPQEQARQGLEAARQSCASDGYDEEGCAKAVELLTAATARDPSLTDAKLELAAAQWNRSYREPKGSPRRAAAQQRSLQLYRSMTAPDARDARPFFELSVRVKALPERQQLLERAVKLDPRHVGAHRDLAEVFLRQNRPADAARIYLRLQEIRTRAEPEDAGRDLAFARRIQTRGLRPEAARIVGGVLDQTRDEPQSRRCAILRGVDPKAYEGAGDVGVRLRALMPACAGGTGLRRAIELERSGDRQQAIRELEQEVQKNPQNAESNLMLGRLYRETGDGAKATETIRRFSRNAADADERCRLFRSDPHFADALAPDDRAALARSCPPPR